MEGMCMSHGGLWCSAVNPDTVTVVLFFACIGALALLVGKIASKLLGGTDDDVE